MADQKRPRKAKPRKPTNGKGLTLSLLEDSFCRNYLLAKGNGAEAVRLSGYAAANPGAQAIQAYKLLQKPKIQARIQYLRDHAADVIGLNEVEIGQILADIIRLDPRKIADWGPGYLTQEHAHDGFHVVTEVDADGKVTKAEVFHEGISSGEANAIAGISIRYGQFGTSVDIKPYSRLDAIAHYNKMMGLNQSDKAAAQYSAGMLELKRQQLQLERERLELERRKIELAERSAPPLPTETASALILLPPDSDDWKSLARHDQPDTPTAGPEA